MLFHHAQRRLYMNLSTWGLSAVEVNLTQCFVTLGWSNQSALKVTVKPVTNINSSKPFFFKYVHKYLGPQSISAILYDDMMGTIITYVFNMYRFYWLPTWILQPRVMHETMIVTLQFYKIEWIYMKMRVWTWGSIKLHREIIITNHTHLFEIFQTCACWIPGNQPRIMNRH